MSYRNKTYVIFDADQDMRAYALMKSWKENDHIDFNFFDAHDIRPLTDRASDQTVFDRLRERMANSKQAIVLIGEKTRTLRKFVPWEIEIAKRRDLPIVVVNLNNLRGCDPDRCPLTLKEYPSVHVAFRMKIIQHALNEYVPAFNQLHASWESSWRYYPDDVYTSLGL